MNRIPLGEDGVRFPVTVLPGTMYRVVGVKERGVSFGTLNEELFSQVRPYTCAIRRAVIRNGHVSPVVAIGCPYNQKITGTARRPDGKSRSGAVETNSRAVLTYDGRKVLAVAINSLLVLPVALTP